MTIRVGMVGVGWGTVVHAPAFQAVEGYELVALCSRSPEKTVKAGAKFGISDLSNDWQSFVRRDDLDLISVATPVDLHKAVTLAALAASKHVLCEKPLALSAADCLEMTDAAAASDRQTAVCFELRWTRERSLVRTLVNQGTVGQPYFVRLNQSADYWHPTHANQSLWMYDVTQGGGYLMGMAAHDIDFVASLFGRPVEVCADVRTMVAQRALPDGGTLDVSADDTSVLLLRLETGALAVLSTSVVGAHTSATTFEVFGADGTISGSIAPRGQEVPILAGRATDAGLADPGIPPRRLASGVELPARGATDLIKAQAFMLEDWLPALEGGVARQPIPSFADGLLVARVIEAARASAAGAGWVRLANVRG